MCFVRSFCLWSETYFISFVAKVKSELCQNHHGGKNKRLLFAPCTRYAFASRLHSAKNARSFACSRVLAELSLVCFALWHRCWWRKPLKMLSCTKNPQILNGSRCSLIDFVKMLHIITRHRISDAKSLTNAVSEERGSFEGDRNFCQYLVQWTQFMELL